MTAFRQSSRFFPPLFILIVVSILSLRELTTRSPRPMFLADDIELKEPTKANAAALGYNYGVKVYNISYPSITISKINEVYLVDIHLLQETLSQVLFWSHTTPESRAMYLADIADSNIVQKNYAVVDFATLRGTRQPVWELYNDFLISSTAFTQLYYLELFKADLPVSVQKLSLTSPTPKILDYEPLFFSWLKQPIRNLYDTFSGRGIVIAAGNAHFLNALLVVRTLREVVKCTLPIELVYANNNDLSLVYRRMLDGLDAGVKLIDLSERVDVSRIPGVHGWWIKPFAIIVSSFQEVIYMDADVVFMIDPIELFENPNYKTYGQVFYRDRRMAMGKKMEYAWMKDSFSFASGNLLGTALWNETSKNELDSSVLLYNKGNPSSFFGLLNICNLNRKPMQDHISWIFKEKETHWIGFELLALPYTFEKSYAGAIGYSQAPGVICGQNAHSDETGKILFFNDGVDVRFRKMDDEIDSMVLNFEFYTSDSGRLGEWEWSENGSIACWRAPMPETQIKELTTKESEHIDSVIGIFKENQESTFTIFID